LFWRAHVPYRRIRMQLLLLPFCRAYIQALRSLF
jgi:hypothetical protein